MLLPSAPETGAAPSRQFRKSESRSFADAVKWAYSANWGERAFSALFSFVLAFLLGPRDFGIASLALIYITFIQMFLDQGLVAALIQRKTICTEHLNTVFCTNVGLGLFLVLPAIFVSRWWARVNHVSELASIIAVLTLCIPIEGLSIVQKALLQREMDFKSLSIRGNVSALSGGVAGIALAYMGCGVWSLVGQQIVRDFTALLLLWKLNPWRPSLAFSLPHLKELLSFSFSNFGAQLAIFADQQSGAIVLGIFVGPAAVGLYRLAERLMNTILVTATSSIQSVSLPEFSRLQDDKAGLRKSVLLCLRLSSMLTLPALAGLASISAPLLALIGPSWAPASGALQILCAMGMLLTFTYFTGPVLQALARPHHLAALEWGRVVVGTALLLVVSALLRTSSTGHQVAGIALARFATAALVIAPLFLGLLLTICGIRLREFAKSVMPGLIAAAGVLAAVYAVGHVGPHTEKPLLTLAIDILVGGTVAAALLLSADYGLRKSISNLLRAFWADQRVAKQVV